MADKKISELNQVVEVCLTDMLLIVQNGTSKRASAQQLSTLLNTDLTLGELSDVSVADITDGQAIMWDATANKYIPTDLPNTTSINNIITSLVGVTTSLSNVVSSIQTVVGAYDAQIAAVSVRVTSVDSYYATVTGAINAAVASVESHVNTVSSALTSTQSITSVLALQVNTVSSALTSTQSITSVLALQVNTVSSALTSTQSITSVLALQVNAVSAAVTSLSGAKQDTLVSGTNIKTINGDSILGSGNLVVSGGGGGGSSPYLATSSAGPTVLPIVAVSAIDSLALGDLAVIGSVGNRSIAIGHARTVGEDGISIQTLDSSIDEWGAAAARSIVIGPGYVEAGSTDSVVFGSNGASIIGNSRDSIILGEAKQISGGSRYCAILNSTNSEMGFGAAVLNSSILNSTNAQIGYGAIVLKSLVLNSTNAQIGYGGLVNHSVIINSPNSEIGYGGSSLYDTILGGSSNYIGYSANSNGYNLILGGGGNTINDASNCVVVGGSGATIGGGVDNSISFGGGKLPTSNMIGFTALSTGQTSLYIQSEVTSDATPTILSTTNPFNVGLGSFYIFKIYVGGKSSTPEQAAGYEFTGTIRNFSGTTSFLGSVTKTVLGEDNAAWDCNVTANDTTDTLDITVTGENAVEVLWCASIYVTQVF